MDIEQLKLILETLRSIADTAGTAGIVWLCAHYFVLLVQAIAVPVAAAAVLIVAARQFGRMHTSKDEKASANELEQTKREEIRTRQKELELEKAKVETGSRGITKQLVAIAEAAKVSNSEYSGIYHAKDLEAIIAKVKA